MSPSIPRITRIRVTPIQRAAPCLAISLIAAAIGSAYAQTAPAAKKTEEPETNTQTIMVTAQKRLQEAQNVPISLYSATGQTLERTGITNIEELGNSVAGVTIGALQPGFLQINIRGVTDNSQDIQIAAANGLYVDEAPLNGVPGTQPDISLFDIERVEVLRGPQGTLFGEGSMGGTIRVILKKPDSRDFFGRFKVGGSKMAKGGGSGYNVAASLNVPLSAGVAGMSVAAGRQKIPGWISIPDLGLENANSATRTDARLAFRLTPLKPLSVDASLIYGETKNGDYGATTPGVLDPAVFFPGAGKVQSQNQRQTTNKLGNVTVNYDLGPVNFLSTSTLFNQKIKIYQDASFILPLFFGPLGAGGSASGVFPTNSKVFTQEFRLASTGTQQLNWTTGLYYKNSKIRLPSDTGYTFNLPNFLPVALVNDQSLTDTNASTKAYAVFGDAEYAITSTLGVQAGLRWYKEKKDYSILSVTSSTIFGTKAGDLLAGNSSATATSPKVVLNWKLAPDVLVFGKVAKGFRGGGANSLPPAYKANTPPSYGPESVVAYEAGLKTTIGGGWYLNASIYHNNWKDLQLPILTPDGLQGFTVNAGKADANGAELELGGRVLPGLNTALTFAYIDAKLKTTVINQVNGSVVAQEGNSLPLTSKLKYGISADYTFAVAETMKAQVVGRYQQASSTNSEINNLEILRNPPRKSLYARTALRGDSWEAGLYGDNLLNRDDTTNKRRPITAIPLVYNSYVAPRTIGVDFKLNF